MDKEIKFQIKVNSEKDFNKIHETLRVHIANLELAGVVKIVDLGIETSISKSK
jgi:hypothetical protein